MEEQNLPAQDNFVKRIIFILVFFTITPLTLFSSVFSLIVISNSVTDTPNVTESNLINSPKSGVNVYAALPDTFPSVSGEVVAADARPEIIREYLQTYKSPMEPYADFIVQTADKYGLDYRLITAIAQKESGLGKAMPKDCFNPFGWGIHSKGTLCFDNWEEGIEAISKGLKENYIDQGYVTVPEIMKKYAHPSSTTWAEGVLSYMDQLE